MACCAPCADVGSNLAADPTLIGFSLEDLEKPVPADLAAEAWQHSEELREWFAGSSSLGVPSVGAPSSTSALSPSLFLSHRSVATVESSLPEVRGLSSTQFHPSVVVRGVSPNVLLHSAGALLQNGQGRRNDESLSEELQAPELDIFISHSWSVGRWTKFIAMALYFNGRQSALISLLVQVLCFVLTASGVMPLVARDSTVRGISPWCILFGSVAFWLAILSWHEAMLALKRRKPTAFFDTVCIDQSNEEKKREGIEAITAYLWHSKRLFVILSDVYLQRIWTVFEMSAFLAAKTSNTRMGGNRSGRNLFDFQKEGGANVIVQPVALASLVPTCFVFQWVRALGDYARYNLTQWGRNGIDTDLIVALVFSVLALLQITSLVLILQRWGRTRANLKHQVETFSFNEAKCHHEPDRKQISLAVKYLAERSRLVSSEASLQEAQEALEGHARQMVWPVMAGALSHAGIPFWDAWVIGVPVAAVALDDISVDIASGFGVNFVGLLARLVAVLNFPIVLALISISASTQSSCCWWMVGTILRVFFVTAFTSTRGWMNAQVEEYAKGQGIPRLGLLLSLVFLVQILVLWCSYGDGVKRMRRCIRRCCSRDS